MRGVTILLLYRFINDSHCKKFRAIDFAVQYGNMELARSVTMPDGVQIAYGLWKPGAQRRLVVLLHGVASNRSRWSEFLEYTTLKETWDILRLDLRGHGQSTTRKSLGIRQWCTDLTAIMEFEKYNEALIVGHSLGAQVALYYAVLYPYRVMGLVLLDPLFREALRGKSRWLVWCRWVLRIAAAVVQVLNACGLRRRRLPELDLRKTDEEIRKRTSQAPDQVEEKYSSAWEDLKIFPTANYLRELFESTAPMPRLSGISAPVLVLLSSGATFADPHRTRQALQEFPNVQTIVIDSFHWPLTEKPVEVRQAIEKWCAETF